MLSKKELAGSTPVLMQQLAKYLWPRSEDFIHTYAPSIVSKDIHYYVFKVQEIDKGNLKIKIIGIQYQHTDEMCCAGSEKTLKRSVDRYHALILTVVLILMTLLAVCLLQLK